jgi:hypothetical protein
MGLLLVVSEEVLLTSCPAIFKERMITEITQDETALAIKNDPKAFAAIVKDKVIPELDNLMTLLNEHHECREFEICLMDIASIRDNLTDFIELGPSAPFVKIRLEDSEIPADAPENMPVGLHLAGE